MAGRTYVTRKGANVTERTRHLKSSSSYCYRGANMNATKDHLPAASSTSMSRRVMTRRELLRYASLGTLGLLGTSALAASAEWLQEQRQHFEGQDVFARIVDKSSAENWK